MYLNHYGLREKPFNLTPDPEYFFMSPVHENAYTHMEYALAENKGFVVITGEIGSGKTILINYLLRRIPQSVHLGIVNHTNIEPAEFLKMICEEFELNVNGRGRHEMLRLFHDFLVGRFAEKKRVLLIIDEAQNLPDETIEEIRMLSNLESDKHHLLQIVLVGQPELREKLKQRNLRQFAQRVTVYCHLKGMKPNEVEQYIRHRLHVAGAADTEIFSKGSIHMIYKHSGGIPRSINALCDAALVYGFADEHKRIDGQVIQQVVREKGELGANAFETAAEAYAPPAALSDDTAYLQRVESIEIQVQELLSDLPRQMEDQKTADGMFRRKLVDILKKLLMQERKRTRALRDKIELLEKRVAALEREGIHRPNRFEDDDMGPISSERTTLGRSDEDPEENPSPTQSLRKLFSF